MLDMMALREVLYDILNASDQTDAEEHISLTQQMGVDLSQAVRKEGVSIIQLQNVVNRRVISHVTLALRMLDTAQKEVIPVVTVEKKEIEHTPSLNEESLRAGITMDEFLKKIEKDYLDTALSLYGKRKARRILGLTPSRYINMRRRHGFPVGKDVGDFE